MATLAAGLDYVDLNFLGRPGIIATAVLRSAAGVALVDPGPSTTLDSLRATLGRKGISIRDIREVLLTHIHLDHAGGTGSLLRENPDITVYVHAVGARHMIDPAKLLASASRLYGPDMERLWGEVLPVPVARVVILEGGERIGAGGRELEVAYTPGHASHHVSYFDPSSRVAFVGDTAGIRRGGRSYVMPPTPPPDIDLEQWRSSIHAILDWDPDTLFLTHFGPYQGARQHMQQLIERIDEWTLIARRLVRDEAMSEEDREQRFVDEVLLELKRAVGESEADQYSRAGRIDYSWQGLARYIRKSESRD